MAANRLPASLMNALDPAAGARRSRLTAARAGAPRCPYISRRSRPASGQTLTVPSSFRRGELPRRLRAPFARNVIPGAHAADRARSHSRCRSRDRTRRRLHKFLPVVDVAPLRCVRIQTPAESRYDSRPEALRAPTKRPWGGALPDLVLRSQGSEHASDRAPFHSSDSLSENLSYSASRASSACRLWHAHPQERGVER